MLNNSEPINHTQQNLVIKLGQEQGFKIQVL